MRASNAMIDRQNRIVHHVTCLVFLLAAALTAEAGDGRIPIWEPTTITESGSYVVTRDIVGPGVIIDIADTAENVTIDLNGFTLETTSSGPVVQVIRPPVDASGEVHVANGTLKANESPAAMTAMTLKADGLVAMGLEKTRSIGDVEVLNSKIIEILENKFEKGGLRITGSGTRKASGRLSGNYFRESPGHAIEITQGSAMIVNDTTIEMPVGDGVRCVACDATVIEKSAVEDASGNGVHLMGGVANHLKDLAIVRAAGSGILVDATSQGNQLQHIGAHFCSGHGLLNDGSQTSVLQTNFSGNAGGGIKNTGSQLSLLQVMSRGNGGLGLEDLGFDTWASDNCFD